MFVLNGSLLTTGNRNSSTTVAGQITNGFGGVPGTFTKVGTGTLTLAGENTYTGLTTVAGGTLRVDGAIAGDVLVRLISPSRPDYREKIWDQAAGSIVVTEAGGRITDLDARPLDFAQGRTLAKNRGILATNGLLHEPMLTALRKIGA